MRVAALALTVLLVAPLAGCIGEDRDPHRPPAGARNALGLPEAEDWTGPNLTVAGRVVDALSGAPLANASVRLSLFVGSAPGPCPGVGLRLPWQSWELDVREDGAFGPLVVPAPSGNGTAFRFGAEAGGYLPESRKLAPDDAVLGALDVRLAPGSSLVVRGGPGSVAVWERQGAGPEALGHRRLAEGAPEAASLPAGVYRVVVTTPGEASWATEVEAPAFGSASVEAEAAEAPPAAPRVEGRASTEGSPAGHSVVFARDAEGRLVAAAVARADGNFTLVLPGPGPFDVLAFAGPGVSSAVRVKAAENATARAELDLPPGLACPPY